MGCNTILIWSRSSDDSMEDMVKKLHDKMYLSSYEYEEFHTPREITSLEKLKIESRIVFKVTIDTFIYGQKYGLGDMKIDTLFLIGRFENSEEISKFPFEIHVFIPKENNNNTVNVLEQLQNIGWASVYLNKKDASKHLI
ncbi:MAG: hypothetical protein K0U38_05225 [Epsilonproteobacteria bacterium]|nr:hypothetical protein [Campylobacterota bacterium]